LGDCRFGGILPNLADTLGKMEARTALLAWFDRHKRDLPWRATGEQNAAVPESLPDPYRVWISEIMLQQTRVETVIPFYLRFLARYPDLATLAHAQESDVLAAWSGLGYYRRCRGLLAAARELAQGEGRLPRTARELERLPGIGPYTAAAIASIAFGEVVPVLDGNVERVLSRLTAAPGGGRRRKDRVLLLERAATLLEPSRPGDSNQALMELGATLCTPRAPGCPQCPLAAACAARVLGAPESFPAPPPRAGIRRVRQVVALVESDGRWLLFRRSASAGQLASMWEFPAVELSPGGAPAAQLAARFGGIWEVGERRFGLRHAITDQSFAIAVHRAALQASGSELAESPEGSEAGWWSYEELAGMALTGVARKVLALARDQPG
jgi:A/G-specific adenine glycosylase